MNTSSQSHRRSNWAQGRMGRVEVINYPVLWFAGTYLAGDVIQHGRWESHAALAYQALDVEAGCCHWRSR